MSADPRLQPGRVLIAGLALLLVGVILEIALPLLGNAAIATSTVTSFEQDLLLGVELVLRMTRIVVPPVGAALVGAAVVMAYVKRLVGSRSPADRAAD